MTREEAIKEIKSWDFLEGNEIEAIQTLIPELVESKDEKIGNVIYCIVRDNKEVKRILEGNGISLDNALAYLERQKEPENMSASTMIPSCWEVEQKEQKLINNSTREKIISKATSEKQVVLLSESNGNAEIGWDTRSLEDAKKLLEYGIAFINEQLGTKPEEWSEEDEKIYQTVFNHFNSYEKYSCSTGVKKEHVLSWLKSLKPSWKPSEDEECKNSK